MVQEMNPGAVQNVAEEKLTGTSVAVQMDTGNDAQAAMQTLTAQWYKAVVGGLNLDETTFQLIQGAEPLDSTSEAMWKIFDAVPPASITHYFNPSEINSFSASYGGVISNLIPPDNNNFITKMSDEYSKWAAYKKSPDFKIPDKGGILAVFKAWATINMDSDKAEQCYQLMQQSSENPIDVAQRMWNSLGDSDEKAYNKTIDQLNGELQNSPKKSVSMDSQSQSSDITHTWAHNESGGFLGLFGSSSSYDSLTTVLTQAGLTITATFTRVVTFAVGPLASISTDPDLSDYKPWYNSEALSIAYHTPDNTVWSHSEPTWADTFGPKGNMLRTTSALVVVDGIDVQIKSNNALSTDLQAQFNSSGGGGFFPFFESDGSNGWSVHNSTDAQGCAVVGMSTALGNPIVLGCIVTPISGSLSVI